MQSNFFLNSPSSSSGGAPGNVGPFGHTAATSASNSQMPPGYANALSSPMGMMPSPSPSARGYMAPPFSPASALHQQHPQVMASQPYPSSAGMGMQRFPFPAPPTVLQHLPRRPPMLFTGVAGPTEPRYSPTSHDATLRALQERVSQVVARAPPPPPTLQDLAMFNAQHITPRNGPDPTRSNLQELTHLNPRGGTRVQPYFAQLKIPSPSGTVMPPPLPTADMYSFPVPKQTQEDVQKLLQFAQQSNTMRSRSTRSAATSASASPKTDLESEIPELEDPEGKKSIEEWKKFRLRVMSRLRKQRWRAKKKAEVLAGVEHTRLEEEERLRRDRIRKQQQRAKKRQRILEEQQGGAAADGSNSASSGQSSATSSQGSDSPGSTVSSDSENSDDEEQDLPTTSTKSPVTQSSSSSPSAAEVPADRKPAEGEATN